MSEVYPNASLRLVTAEFRFPLSPRLSGDPLDTLSDLLSERLPIIEPAGNSVGLEFSSASAQPQLLPAREPAYRFMERDRRTALTVQPGRFAVEVTAYTHWEEFRELIRWALEKIGNELHAIVALDRLGIRYIDEIRVPSEPEIPSLWSSFIDEHLLAPLQLADGFDVKALHGALQLSTGEGCEMVVRYGTLTGHLVADIGPLQLLTPAGQGPTFYIDTDSYWTRPVSRQDEFDVDTALGLADAVHAPVSALFERAITERLRDEVLRSAR
jgi:uncharacterized protein (TIGR04255 family)